MIWRRLLGYLPASLTGGIAAFGSVVVLTRLMPAETYGWYALAITTMGVAYTLTLTWAEAAAYRFTISAEAEGRLPDHIRTVFGLIVLSLGVALTALMLIVSFVSQPQLKLALSFVAGVMVLMPIVNSAQEIARARGEVRRYSAIRMSQDIGAFVLGATLAWASGLGAAAPLAGMACVLTVLAVIQGWRLLKLSSGGVFRANEARRYFAYGAPIAIALAMNIALDTGDRILIALYLGPEAVGVYAAGYGVTDKTIGLLCLWGATAGGPLMLAVWEREGAAAVTDVSRRIARAMLLVAAPAACGLALVAQPLSDVMIGEALRVEAARIIPFIALSGLLAGFAACYFSEAFQIARRTDLRAMLAAIPVALNIGLNMALLPVFGLMGAVYATLASYALAIALFAFVGRRLVPMGWPWADMAKVAAACAIMAAGVLALPQIGGFAELALKAGVGAILYALAAIALDASGARGVLAGFRRSTAAA